MNRLHEFRRRVLGLNRSVLPVFMNRRLDRRRIRDRMEEGLPAGLDPTALRAIVEEQRGARMVEASYGSLQAWKLSSASLVMIKLEDNTSWSLVFKEARFDDDYPAIAGLDMPVGRPEHALYTSLTSDLQRFTPRLFSVIEVSPGNHYQYLMEDLRSHFHPVYSERDKLPLLERMPAVHNALADWASRSSGPDLLRYDEAFVDSLLRHAETGLEGFVSKSGYDLSDAIGQVWPDVVAYLTAEPILASRRLRPIHGDFNTKNAFLSNKWRHKQVRLVDWEWAGYGTPHDDVASLMKRPNEELEQRVLTMLCDWDRELTRDEHLHLLWWSRLFTMVLDASLLSHQYAGLASPPPVVAVRAQGLWGGLLRMHSRFKESIRL